MKKLIFALAVAAGAMAVVGSTGGNVVVPAASACSGANC